jgi:hypothetical protein
MQETRITCDKCKSVVIGNFYESGYKRVELKFSDRNIARYDLCPSCLKVLGLNEPIATHEECESVGEKLYDLIAEIVAENTQQ